ncbi:MAG TPA: PIG-L family deacetylase [Microlunatus sp.]
MLPLVLGRVSELVLIGAHCDDIVIGAAGLVATIIAGRPEVRIRALVMTGAESEREHEERAALGALASGAALEVRVLGLPDGHLPEHWAEVKLALGDLAASGPADLVLAPHRHDAHQDHRLLGELTPTAFRDRLILGYEILKWESDLPSTTIYQPLAPEQASAKVELVERFYRSQAGHDWFDREAFLGLMRVRGAQAQARYAEAFVAEKLTLAPG